MKTLKNVDGYNLVMATIRARLIADGGTGSNASQWLADELGITRQAVHVWSKTGTIPDKYIPAISKLTGLSAVEIRPESAAMALSAELFSKIAKTAKERGLSFAARLNEIITNGLKQ